MILADKIIRLRKKNCWSQEELAEKMNVSRQAVSKWESRQSVPDLEKILQLSNLFGVTTDYLLKDEIEAEEFSDVSDSDGIKRISAEEANRYLDSRKKASCTIAAATALCIASPIPMFLAAVASEVKLWKISENTAGIVGLALMFVFILIAVPMFVYCELKNAPYSFLEKNIPFELEYGVRGIVKEWQDSFRDAYIKGNIIATCLCIFSPLPLILSAFTENEFLCVVMLAVTMLIAGAGACVFITVGVRMASFQKLLKEGEYTPDEKKKSVVREAVGFSYWGVLVAIYLCCSFLTNQWHLTWIVFAVGAILFPVVMTVCNMLVDKRK